MIASPQRTYVYLKNTSDVEHVLKFPRNPKRGAQNVFANISIFRLERWSLASTEAAKGFRKSIGKWGTETNMKPFAKPINHEGIYVFVLFRLHWSCLKVLDFSPESSMYNIYIYIFWIDLVMAEDRLTFPHWSRFQDFLFLRLDRQIPHICSSAS